MAAPYVTARRRRPVLRSVLLFVGVGALVASGFVARIYARSIVGYAAKVECSCVFVAGRAPGSCRAEELGRYHAWFRDRVDTAARTVEVSAFGLARARADFDEAMGCTLR
jgi:hypothetical protein